MLKICLVFWESEPQYAYKRYAYKKTYTTHNRDPDGTLTLSYMRYDHIFFIIRPMREFHLLQNEMLINVAQNTFPVVKMTFFMALNLVYTE